MKSNNTISFFAGLLVLLGLFAVVSGDRVSNAPAQSKSASVEIGLAEVSPKGEAGGYAVPASGSGGGGQPSATLNFSLTPSTIQVGQPVKMTWSWSGGSATHITISRCNTPGQTGSECSNWTTVQNLDGRTFGGGTTSYSCFGFLTCHRAVVSGTSPLYDAKANTLAPGRYVYRAVLQSGHEVPKDATLTVQGTIADLTTYGIGFSTVYSSVPDKKGVFIGGVKNIGNASTQKGFTNKFEYRWNGTENWTAFGTPTAPTLAQSAETGVKSGTVTLRTTGILEVRLCADSTSVIQESDESNNCGASASFDMKMLYPGLAPIRLDRTLSGGVGSTITFSGTVLNAGGAAAPASSARFCMDNANCATNATRAFSTPAIPALSAGAVTNPALTGSWTATVGSHTAYFCVVGGSCLHLSFTITTTPEIDDTENTTNPAPQQQVTLTADDFLVRQGEHTMLRWNAGNSTCTLTGTNGLSKSGLKGTGSTPSGTISKKSVFTFKCTRGSSVKIAPQVTVNIIPVVKEI